MADNQIINQKINQEINQEIIDALRQIFTPDAESLTPEIEPASIYELRETDDCS